MKKINIKIFKDNIIANKVYDIILNTNESLFLTGKAGTGKSTLLKCILKDIKKKFIVLAPTGVAAKNVEGLTIHSFFKIPYHLITSNFKLVNEIVYNTEELLLIRELELIVIDEVSMMNSVMLDVIDRLLRKHRNSLKPFGGVQILLIGDPLQLPPIVKDEELKIIRNHWDSVYFFDSKCFRNSIKNTFELTICYRQNDSFFINILDGMRTNTLEDNEFEILNRICKENNETMNAIKSILITPHNKIARFENQNKLNKIKGKTFEYISLEAGIFNKNDCNAEVLLKLKTGSKVMFIKNNKFRGYTNGTLGIVEELYEDVIVVRTEDNAIINVMREEWIEYKYGINPITGQFEKKEIGIFSQFPLKLGWAITVNKSQGLTFDSIHLDFRWGAFSTGQTYVAFSRCKSIEKITTSTPILKKDVFVDPRLINFYKSIY